MAKQQSEIEIDGRHIKLSNLGKVLYPQAGFTKGQVIDYYVKIAPVLLPHLSARPLTLKRYPEGVNGLFFYEKNCPRYRPDWIKTVKVWSEGNQRFMYYCVVEDVATLVWLANLADLELHTSLSRAPQLERPTVIAFDLDPGAPANIIQCCQVALWVREIFDQFGMQSFPKTSGSKGLQLYVPLNTTVTYDQTKPFARAIARLLEERHPDHVVSDMKKSLRANKVLVDWSQNDVHKTTVNVYSLRAREQPTVSTPVTWEEVEQCLRRKDPALLAFTSSQVLERVDRYGDLFAPVLDLRQKLPNLEKLEVHAAAEPEKQPLAPARRPSQRVSGTKPPSPARPRRSAASRKGKARTI